MPRVRQRGSKVEVARKPRHVERQNVPKNLIGLALFVPGWALVTWSMSVNPFFEKQVRIQTNHGHFVIDGGPHSLIRHHGYVGFDAVLLATPLLLDSVRTLIPAGIAVLLLVIRTALEDRMLQAELPGYREYAGRVR